jgi:hypothetical protein
LPAVAREQVWSLDFEQIPKNWRREMMYDVQVAVGDICRDPTGLRVKVEEVDVYDYVHFSVIEASEFQEDEAESGEMSCVAFVHRFMKLGNAFIGRKAA